MKFFGGEQVDFWMTDDAFLESCRCRDLYRNVIDSLELDEFLNGR